jgi:hypothetical protein
MDVTEVLSDVEVEAVLSGRPLPDRPDLDDLVALVVCLRDQVARQPVPAMGAELRIALAEVEARLLSSLAAAPAGSSRDPAPTPQAAARRWGLAGAAALLLVVASLGIGAAGDLLPDPLQSVAATAAKRLGVDLPHPGPPAGSVGGGGGGGGDHRDDPGARMGGRDPGPPADRSSGAARERAEESPSVTAPGHDPARSGPGRQEPGPGTEGPRSEPTGRPDRGPAPTHPTPAQPEPAHPAPPHPAPTRPAPAGGDNGAAETEDPAQAHPGRGAERGQAGRSDTTAPGRDNGRDNAADRRADDTDREQPPGPPSR